MLASWVPRDEEGASIPNITHDIASVRYVTDRLIVLYGGRIAESGAIEDVLARLRHPYTELLVSAAPDPQAPLSVTAETDRGEPPQLIDPSPGCRFRCPVAVVKCGDVIPELATLAPAADADGAVNRKISCHVAQSGDEVKAFS